MSLQLRQNLHWCLCEGRAIFLDVEADRYFCLPKSANDAFLALAGGDDTPDTANSLSMLIERGLLVETSFPAGFATCATTDTPARDLIAGSMPRIGLVAFLRALVRELQASWLIRTRPFHEVISVASKRRSVQSSIAGGERGLVSAVAAADAVSFATRAHNRCLVRALAVDAECIARGFRPKLVFGVIAHPFAAHCWVQLGDAVLVGGYEHARLYTPILVLE